MQGQHPLNDLTQGDALQEQMMLQVCRQVDQPEQGREDGNVVAVDGLVTDCVGCSFFGFHEQKSFLCSPLIEMQAMEMQFPVQSIALQRRMLEVADGVNLRTFVLEELQTLRLVVQWNEQVDISDGPVHRIRI